MVRSQPVRVAVAANAQFVIKQLQGDFKSKTGIETEAIIGSSGNLTAQIKNGAPFDLFLSADMDFPNDLFKNGFAITTPKEYASGSLIICSNGNVDLKNWRSLLLAGNVQKIAIANPAIAPYGKAAEEALRHYGLWDKINNKLVYGESISQVNTYITTGTVGAGFTTEALIYEFPGKEKLKWQRVDKTAYNKISQGYVVLSYSRKGNYANAMKFYNYISSPEARKVFKQFGYQVL
jgi:molybdate transport system substrate-binding protein